jgi:outer membrane immunogenic protein
MRRFLLAVAIVGTATAAQAADMPDFLRGSFTAPVARTNWQGFFIGGQGGYGASDENFNGSTRSMMAALLADTLIESAMGVSRWDLGLGKSSARSSGYGAFAGYNSQWTDVVVGLEMSYLHGKFGGSTTASEGRNSGTALSDGYIHDVTATSSAAISISDMATFRVRAGYAYGCFLPYVFGGVALGNADISRSVFVRDNVTPGPTNPPNITLAPLRADEIVHNHLIYGYSAGLGVDVNLIGGLFMRAEWEYIRFTSTVDTNVNTVRAGLGYKF